MNLIEQFQALDWRDPGRWPLSIRVMVASFVFVVASFLFGMVLIYNTQMEEYEQVQTEQDQLWAEFEQKQHQAANFAAYRAQLKDMERSFGAMLRQLPGRTEVPNLLVDISQTGNGAGLDEKLFQPGAEQKQDFYAELPIKIRLTGSYHEFGNFVSGIAALPRIVTLHDIQIQPELQKSAGADQLVLDLTAKTYRYLEDDEMSPDSKQGKRKGARHEASAVAGCLRHALVCLRRRQRRDAGPRRRNQEASRWAYRAAARDKALRNLQLRSRRDSLAVRAG